MAVSAKVVLSRTAYVAIQTGAGTLSVSLPKVPQRIGQGDTVELIKAAAAPPVPANPEELHELGIYLVNKPGNQTALLNMQVMDGENLYGRWVSIADKPSETAADRYVVTL